jgi:hypothetical protein
VIISTRTWIRGLLLLFLLFDLAVVGFVGVYRYYNRQLPKDLTAIQDYDPSVLSQVYAADLGYRGILHPAPCGGFAGFDPESGHPGLHGL